MHTKPLQLDSTDEFASLGVGWQIPLMNVAPWTVRAAERHVHRDRHRDEAALHSAVDQTRADLTLPELPSTEREQRPRRWSQLIKDPRASAGKARIRA